MEEQQPAEISRSRSLQMRISLSQSIPSRYRGPARGARYAFAVILVTAWSGISAAALAQSDPLPRTNGQGRMSAPIGHRQPRAQDLPPDVLREEGMTRQPPEPDPGMRPDASRERGDPGASRIPFGDELQICRQC
jgi:hypothetical protein